MMWIDYLRLVYKYLVNRKGRVFLTVSGIIIGIFTFTFFIFVSQGLNNAIYEQFASFGLNTLSVQPAGSTGEPTGEGLTEKQFHEIKSVISEYKYMAPAIYYRVNYEYDREKSRTVTLAYPDEYLNEVKDDMGFEILEGRSLRPADRGVVMLGYKFAKESFEDKDIKVGNSLKVNDESYRVVGILEERGDLFIDNSVMMDYGDLKDISGQDTYSVIDISFYEEADLEYYEEAILRQLNPRDGEKVVTVSSSQDIIEQFNQIIGLLTAIILFISSIALVVGGINVMNTMYSNVVERTSEISVMKALGARNEEVRNLFLMESSLMGFLGGFLGFMLSYLLAEVLSYVISTFGYNVPIYFNWWVFAGVLGGTMILTAVFGTYPALRAARINPADNLESE